MAQELFEYFIAYLEDLQPWNVGKRAGEVEAE
jgi:hypothetical protein